MADQSLGDFLFEFGELQGIVILGHLVERLARKQPDFVALLVFAADQHYRKWLDAAENSTDFFLVGRQPIVQVAKRVAADEIERSGKFLVENRQQLVDKFFFLLLGLMPLPRRRFKILLRYIVLFVLRRLDKTQDAASRVIPAQGIGRRSLLRRR